MSTQVPLPLYGLARLRDRVNLATGLGRTLMATAGIPRLLPILDGPVFPVTDRSFFTVVPCDRFRSVFTAPTSSSPLRLPHEPPPPPLLPRRLFSHSWPKLVRVCFDLPVVCSWVRWVQNEYPWMSNPKSRLNTFLLVSFLLFPQYAMRPCSLHSFTSTK